MKNQLIFVGLIALVLVSSSCNRRPITVYQVPKSDFGLEDSPHFIKWKLTKEWQKRQPSKMQLYKYQYNKDSDHQAILTITMIPGNGGGLLANVNRWRNQLGLGQTTKKALDKQKTVIKKSAFDITVVGLDSTDQHRKPFSAMIAAYLTINDEAWFFKLTGNGHLHHGFNEPFNTFLNSVEVNYK
jgi:hypothetical protein